MTHGGGGNPHLCHMCRINIWAYIHRLAQRGRCKYRNYAHAYFTGIPQNCSFGRLRRTAHLPIFVCIGDNKREDYAMSAHRN